MNDMSPVIVPKSDQLNADDMMAGPLTVTIREVRISPGSEQPVSIVLEGTDKFYRPCKSMSRVLVAAWGPDAKVYVGRSLTLYRDPTVKWGGLEVGGIRISHMSHLDATKTLMLTATKGSRKPHKVLPLTDAPKTTGTEDAATKWANGYIAKIGELDTIEAINAFAGTKAAKLAELQSARPNLHAKVAAAVEARIAALGGPATFDDDDLGDEASAEKTAAEEAVEKVIAQLAEAKDLEAVIAIEKANESHRAFLPEHLIAVLDSAVAMAKTRVGKVEA